MNQSSPPGALLIQLSQIEMAACHARYPRFSFVPAQIRTDDVGEMGRCDTNPVGSDPDSEVRISSQRRP